MFSNKFVAAGTDYSTLTRENWHQVPAPYLRKSFYVEKEVKSAKITVSGLGFYVIYVNGKDITKGLLAPYISAPDDMVYFDEYDLKTLLGGGENVIGLMLGNGMQNPVGGYPWDMQFAKWRGAPKAAFAIELEYADGEKKVIECDETVKCHASPIWFDDLRCGEFYDARKEIPGWNEKGFDDSDWTPAIKAEMPRGEFRICDADPIVVTKEIKPVSITKTDEGYVYDFGVNAAGLPRLTVKGRAGQEIKYEHGEWLKHGKFCTDNINFAHSIRGTNHIDRYICKGEGVETYVPKFTYHGFRYILVQGIDDSQATEDLFTYLVMNSDLKEIGGFCCSDEVANRLEAATKVSTLANFYYFPTDCPHREKNGWTGDAAASAEHTLMNFKAERSYKEWLRNIYKAQDLRGTIPGIVPTGGWGFAWGNGPAWDRVMVYLPYYTYVLRGDRSILEENADMIMKYLNYLSRNTNRNGLVKLGLGDWCPVGRGADDYKPPLEFSDSVIAADICKKAEYIFRELGLDLQANFARMQRKGFVENIRKYYIDLCTMTAIGKNQASQSLAIAYDVFTPAEKPEAVRRLVEMIHAYGDHMDVGFVSARVIFHILAQFGHAELAYKMITRMDYPSYGHLLTRDATSLFEDFFPDEVTAEGVSSLNHHFWGDISNWFKMYIAGIVLNPYRRDVKELNIAPNFISSLDFAEAYHIAPAGEIRTRWERKDGKIVLNITVPEGMYGRIQLPDGYIFERKGLCYADLASGEYSVIKGNC